MKATYDALMLEIEEVNTTEICNRNLEIMNDKLKEEAGFMETKCSYSIKKIQELENANQSLLTEFREQDKYWLDETKRIKADHRLKLSNAKKKYDALNTKYTELQERHNKLALDYTNTKDSLDRVAIGYSVLQEKYDALTDRNELGQYVKTEPTQESVNYNNPEPPDVD